MAERLPQALQAAQRLALLVAPEPHQAFLAHLLPTQEVAVVADTTRAEALLAAQAALAVAVQEPIVFSWRLVEPKLLRLEQQILEEAAEAALEAAEVAQQAAPVSSFSSTPYPYSQS